jgi:hypothetical protein
MGVEVGSGVIVGVDVNVGFGVGVNVMVGGAEVGVAAASLLHPPRRKSINPILKICCANFVSLMINSSSLLKLSV